MPSPANANLLFFVSPKLSSVGLADESEFESLLCVQHR